MRRKMSDEVTRDEMLSLRKRGYSNTEIAEQLECCYATVLRYIGKCGIRRNPRREEQVLKKENRSLISSERLHLTSKCFGGKTASFSLTQNEIKIRPFNYDYASICFEKSEFEEFAKDILAVSQIVGRGDDIQL